MAVRRFYAGIGSRQTPPEVLSLMQRVAAANERRGEVLRSGGAQGADQAFQRGVADPSNMEVYLPWEGFEGFRSGQPGMRLYSAMPGAEAAVDSAIAHHPLGSGLQDRKGLMALMGRNSMQVLGPDLNSPSAYVLGWAPVQHGRPIGGTSQAFRVADAAGVPVINLFDPGVRQRTEQWLSEGQSRSLDDFLLGQSTAAVPFEIVASRGPGANFDVLGMRQGGRTMATVRAPGEPGWLGNPFVADDAGGKLTREEATRRFGELVREKAQDPAWHDAFMGLKGRRIGYYKPEEPAIHLHELQRWIAEQDGAPMPEQPAAQRQPTGQQAPDAVQLDLQLRQEDPHRKAGDALPWILAAVGGSAALLGAGYLLGQPDPTAYPPAMMPPSR